MTTPLITDRRRVLTSAAAAAAASAMSVATASALLGPPAAAQSRRPSVHPLVGQAAPAFDLPTPDGGRARSGDYAGRPLVVLFWGLWCPDCLADAGATAQLAQILRAERIAFLGIHTRGRFGRWGSVPAFFRERGWSFPVALDDDSAAYRDWRMSWVPSYLAVDRAGVIRDFQTDLGGTGVGPFVQRVRTVVRA
jgi:thiol-disulfide isomerase/thioredoxin